MKLTWISIAVVALVLPVAAQAQENPFGQPEYWREKRREERREYYREHRHRYYPQVRAWRQRYYPPVPAVPANHHALCLHEVRAHGTPHLTEQEAMDAAKRHWQAIVRYDNGEKYMNFDTAKDSKFRCARAETNETVGGRVAETITGGSAWRMRCEVVARPCRVELQRTGQ